MPKPALPPFALLLFPVLTEGWVHQHVLWAVRQSAVWALWCPSPHCADPPSSMPSCPNIQWLGDTVFWVSQCCFEVKSTILGSCSEGRKAFWEKAWGSCCEIRPFQGNSAVDFSCFTRCLSDPWSPLAFPFQWRLSWWVSGFWSCWKMMFTRNSNNFSSSLGYIFFQFAAVNRSILISKIWTEEREVI